MVEDNVPERILFGRDFSSDMFWLDFSTLFGTDVSSRNLWYRISVGRTWWRNVSAKLVVFFFETFLGRGVP